MEKAGEAAVCSFRHNRLLLYHMENDGAYIL